MNLSRCLIILLQLYVILSPEKIFPKVSDWFKKAENKSDIHTIDNIDFIYVINLDQRPEKFQNTVNALAPYGITPYRFSAVNGWELPMEAFNDIGIHFEAWMEQGIMGTSYLPQDNFHPSHSPINTVGKCYFCHCMSRGAIGITLSHLSILQDAYDAGYERIWVMEDDIQVIKNPLQLSSLIQKLDQLVGQNGWDILFTDTDTKDQSGKNVICRSYAKRPNFRAQNPSWCLLNEKISPQLRRIGARYGAYSMIVSRAGMEKLLNFFKTYKVFLPFDMDFTLPPGIKLYTVLDDIVSTEPTALSDNASPYYMLRK